MPPAEVVLAASYGRDWEEWADALGRRGFQVWRAGTHSEAQAELERSRPALLIVDRWLAGGDGLDLLRWVRAREALRGTRVLLLGDPAEEAVPAAAPDRCLAKPVDLAALLEAVESLAPGRAPSAPLPTPEGDQFRVLSQLWDVLRRLGDILRTDALSGLLDREYFLGRIREEHRKAERYRQPISAIMLDLDDFKAVNDAHGHDMGNAVLRAVGAAIRGEIRRDIDVASRLHGDEFAVLLPNTPGDGAFNFAARLHRRLQEPDLLPVPATVSMGVATSLVDYRDGESGLLARADRALLSGKKIGKNRITVWGAQGAAPPPEAAAPPDPGGSPPAPAAPPATEEPPAGAGERPGPDPGAAPQGWGNGAGPVPGSTSRSPGAAVHVPPADAILLAFEEKGPSDLLSGFFSKKGIPVEVASTLAEARERIATGRFFLVMADGDRDPAGVAAFAAAAGDLDPDISLFLFSKDGARPGTLRKAGPFQVIPKSFLLSELYQKVRKAREEYQLRKMERGLRDTAGGRG